jgi:hypothetical protein
MTRTKLRTRGLLALGALLAAPVLGGCDRLLEVTNPSAINEGTLGGDDKTIEFMMNGIQGAFRAEYGWLAAHSAAFTDEAIQGHPWSPWNAYDSRDITPDSPAYDGLSYQLLQGARGTADALIPRMEEALGERAATSVQLARGYAYAGYSYVMMGDFMCEAPIELSAPVPQEELYAMAIERFQRALAIATAAGTAEGAADVANLARVGLARTHLDLGETAEAIAAAEGVPDGFEAWVHYVPDADNWRVYNFMNWFAGYRFVGELDLALDPAVWAGDTDPRIPKDPTLRRLGNGARDGLLAFQTQSYSEYAPANTQTFGAATDIRFASGLEARYIVAEAGGLSAAELRAFVNERRAVGGQGDFGGTDAQLRDELLDQRLRDFFLDGHRMGDLRRYEALYDLDLWPTGTMPGLTQEYGTQKCWPVAQSEINANPNM